MNHLRLSSLYLFAGATEPHEIADAMDDFEGIKLVARLVDRLPVAKRTKIQNAIQSWRSHTLPTNLNAQPPPVFYASPPSPSPAHRTRTTAADSAGVFTTTATQRPQEPVAELSTVRGEALSREQLIFGAQLQRLLASHRRQLAACSPCAL